MGTHLSLVKYDDSFAALSQQATVINELPAFTTQNMDLIHKTIYTRHSPDLLSNVPQCECGKWTMEYKLGTICPHCGTPVAHTLTESLETVTWIRAPKGVHGLMNPVIWQMLSDRFSIGSFNLIQYLTDMYYKQPDTQTAKIDPVLAAIPYKRGLNIFIENFDDIMEILFSLKAFRLPKSKSRTAPDFLRRLLEDNKGAIFSKHLPIPHRSLLVVEEGTAGGVYLDEYTPKAINAVLTLAGIDTASAKGEILTNLKLRESRAVRAVARLSEYYYYVCSKRLAKKEGIFRKHGYATRSHWSFRAVVSSITEPHHYRQIFIPWGVGMAVFGLHIYNKMFALGFTPNEIQDFLNRYANQYHPLAELLMNELIAESPNPMGIPATLNRPPSLKRGSIQGVFISRVKRPEEGLTVSMSILIVRPLNCDFDGDALQFTLALDNKMMYALEALAPHMNAFSLDGIRKIDAALEHSKPVVSTTANWMDYHDEPIDQEAYARMMALPDAP